MQNQSYQEQVRLNLRTFHQNLDAGNFSTIGSLLAPDYFWNYEGNIILTAQAGKATLETFVTSALNGLDAQDIYNIVDGSQGAVLFRISGRQSGQFLDLPLQPDGQFNVLSAETFTFNADAQARQVTTVTPLGIMKEQMRAAIKAPAVVVRESLKEAGTTDKTGKARIKETLTSIHLHANAGDLESIAKLAAEGVEVNENGAISTGRDAFVGLATARNAGQGSLPNKLFHDFDILVDGNLGAINYLWQSPQEKDYFGIPVRPGAFVRMRSMLFFEFNDVGLITKGTGVYDESVVNTSLTGTGGYLYP